MNLILSYYIDPKKHTTKVSFHRAEFMYLIAWGEPIDLASYILQTISTKALLHDTVVSLPYGVLLIQFLHALLVPEGPNEITLSHSIAQTCQGQQTVQAAIGRQ